MLTRASLAAINAYQRWLSPYKGFSCAYRVMHGGPGCSGYAKQVIRDHGPLAAPTLMKDRFAACKAAALALAADRQDENGKDQGRRPPSQPRKKRERFCGPTDFCMACGPSPFDGCGGGRGSGGGGGSDCGAPDCSAGSCMPDCSFGCCGN